MSSNPYMAEAADPAAAPASEDAQIASHAVTGGELVDAELLPTAPGPFAFGMRAMFAITAMAAVQFALMSYFGPLFGLLIGIFVCMLVTGGLIVAAVATGSKPGSATMEHLDRLAIRLAVGIVLLFFGTILAGGGQLIYSFAEGARRSWRVQEELGFTYDEVQVWRSDNRLPDGDSIEIKSIVAGGAMDQAGIKPGEILLLPDSASGFISTLDELDGQSIDVTVVSGANGAISVPIDKCPQRVVTVQVPP